jgi:hypothetical protein
MPYTVREVVSRRRLSRREPQLLEVEFLAGLPDTAFDTIELVVRA